MVVVAVILDHAAALVDPDPDLNPDFVPDPDLKSSPNPNCKRNPRPTLILILI